jgi:two-component system, response regulator YesN
MFNLVSTMIEAVDEIGIVEESFLIHYTKQLERLTSCNTIQDMQTQLTQLLAQVCEYITAKRQQDMQTARIREIAGLVGEIHSFIEKRYHDPNLNISMVGEHFKKKPAYLSKLFKDHTGGGLLDYINDIRLEKAKPMLTGTQLTIYEIASSVGYSDVNAFIRIFKKSEGITPGRFKETAE